MAQFSLHDQDGVENPSHRETRLAGRGELKPTFPYTTPTVLTKR